MKNCSDLTKYLLPNSAALALLVCSASSVLAAPINYGDFSDIPPGSVIYLDVTETALTPDDEEPLFGPPNIAVNTLDFDDLSFVASAPDDTADLTDGKLTFTLMSDDAIRLINVSERGDYSVSGPGSAATRVRYVLTILAEVVEVDGIALPNSVRLDGVLASGSKHLGIHSDDGFWGIGASYDVNAALLAAGIDHIGGATKLELTIDNRLEAVSEDLTTAFIAKKDFMIDLGANPVPVPEAGTLALLSLAICGAGAMRRRRI